MYKLFLLGLVHIFFHYSAISQAVPPRAQIITATDTIAPNYSGGPKVIGVRIQLQLSGTFDAVNSNNNTISFSIINGSIPAGISPTFSGGAATYTVTIPSSVWPGAGAFVETPINLFLEFPTVPSAIVISGYVVGQIIISASPATFHYLMLSPDAPVSTKYKPNKPFWIEIGSNFDLLDGIEPNNLFSGIFFHKRDIRKFKFGKQSISTPEQKNLGIFAGVYESKTISTLTRGDFGLIQYYDATSFIKPIPNQPDSLWIFKGAGPIATTQTVRNIGLFFSPQFRVSNGSANEDGLHFFASLWMELQWQKIIDQKDYTEILKIDSSKKAITDIGLYEAKTLKTENDVKSHYLGIGFPVFFRQEIKGEENVHLFINPILGITNQPNREYLSALLNPKSLIPQRKWMPFYAIQFRLNEERFGISFTGEVRGLLKKNNPPFVSIALSKKFDLGKFMEFSK